MGRRFISFGPFVSAFCIFAGIAYAAQRPAGCRDLLDTDFKMEVLAGNPAGGPAANPSADPDRVIEPIHMDFDATPAGVDVYFTERQGRLRVYRAADKKVATLGNVTVASRGELGLLGIALDPRFKENRFLYLYYTYATGQAHRVSRFTLVGDSLAPGSERVLMSIPISSIYFPGGAMKFDAKGDLWITVGMDGSVNAAVLPSTTATRAVSANTHDARGKVLRIHPTPEGGYTIPAGNVFSGADTSKALREIFAMGVNNPFSISFDPATGNAAWADYGQDAGKLDDELNLSGVSGNYGWPFFTGVNRALQPGQDPEHPKAPTFGDALVDLPSAIPAALAVRQSCPIAGPVYRYQAYPDAPGKLPPHFDGMWFVTDFSSSRLDTLSLSATGAAGSPGQVLPSLKLDRPIDLQIGPDGALYVVNYAGWFSTTEKTALLRIAYTGDCMVPVTGIRPASMGPEPFSLSGMSVRVTAAGRYRVTVSDPSGKTVFEKDAAAPADYDLQAMFRGGNGIRLVSVRTADGVYSRPVVSALR